MIKQKIKTYIPKSIWKLLGVAKKNVLRLRVLLILKLANSKSSVLNFFVKNRSKQLVWLDTVQPVKIFKEGKTIDVYEPNYNGNKFFTVDRPQINLYKFNNPKVHGESSHVVLSDSIIMERLPRVPIEYCNYSTGFIKGHDGHLAIHGGKYEVVDVDKAFFLGGNGSWNYYH